MAPDRYSCDLGKDFEDEVTQSLTALQLHSFQWALAYTFIGRWLMLKAALISILVDLTMNISKHNANRMDVDSDEMNKGILEQPTRTFRISLLQA